jgi:hypothetical protein
MTTNAGGCDQWRRRSRRGLVVIAAVSLAGVAVSLLRLWVERPALFADDCARSASGICVTEGELLAVSLFVGAFVTATGAALYRLTSRRSPRLGSRLITALTAAWCVLLPYIVLVLFD